MCIRFMSRLRPMRFAGASLLAVTHLAGCAQARRTAAHDACTPPPSRALVPFAPARALALAGEYEITLLADEGPRTGQAAHGSISLHPSDTLRRYYVNPFGQGWRRRGDRPLMGWGQLHGDVGLMTAGTSLASRDSTWPGIVSSLDSLGAGLRFMFGYRLMLDGGFNELTVTAVSPDGFHGRWESSMGMTTYQAAGFFCARRRREG